MADILDGLLERIARQQEQQLAAIDVALIDAQRLLGDAVASVQALSKMVEQLEAENVRLRSSACTYCGWKRGA